MHKQSTVAYAKYLKIEIGGSGIHETLPQNKEGSGNGSVGKVETVQEGGAEVGSLTLIYRTHGHAQWSACNASA